MVQIEIEGGREKWLLLCGGGTWETMNFKRMGTPKLTKFDYRCIALTLRTYI
jgi:hypothetical protein